MRRVPSSSFVGFHGMHGYQCQCVSSVISCKWGCVFALLWGNPQPVSPSERPSGRERVYDVCVFLFRLIQSPSDLRNGGTRQRCVLAPRKPKRSASSSSCAKKIPKKNRLVVCMSYLLRVRRSARDFLSFCLLYSYPCGVSVGIFKEQMCGPTARREGARRHTWSKETEGRGATTFARVPCYYYFGCFHLLRSLFVSPACPIIVNVINESVVYSSRNHYCVH